MLTELKKLEKNLAKLQKQLPTIIKKAVKNNEYKIIELNQNQLQKGLFPDGSTTPFYSPATLMMKANEGTLNGRNYTLYDSGELYNAMKVIVKDYIVSITSTSKTAKLFDEQSQKNSPFGIERYFGVDEDKLVELIMPDIMAGIKEVLNV